MNAASTQIPDAMELSIGQRVVEGIKRLPPVRTAAAGSVAVALTLAGASPAIAEEVDWPYILEVECGNNDVCEQSDDMDILLMDVNDSRGEKWRCWIKEKDDSANNHEEATQALVGTLYAEPGAAAIYPNSEIVSDYFMRRMRGRNFNQNSQYGCETFKTEGSPVQRTSPPHQETTPPQTVPVVPLERYSPPPTASTPDTRPRRRNPMIDMTTGYNIDDLTEQFANDPENGLLEDLFTNFGAELIETPTGLVWGLITSTGECFIVRTSEGNMTWEKWNQTCSTLKQ